MKKVLSICVLVAAVAIVATSCGKKCVCTYYEDGKKVITNTDKETKYFEKSVCKDQSVAPFQGESQVVPGKSVTIEVKCK